MGYSKLSVTVPDDLFEELKAIAKMKNLKLSRLVTDAIKEKNIRIKEETFIQQVNDIFSDDEIRAEQSRLAESIRQAVDLKELPW